MARKKFQWSREGEDDEEGEVHFTERGNRTEANRAKDKLFSTVKDLVEMKKERRNQLPLSEDVRDAIEEAIRIKNKGKVRGGFRRQLLYVAKVLRQEEEEDIDALYRAIEGLPPVRKR
ncbi:MAG: hypothetical protein CL930_08025 [Deltaproteobacteria bacterium]|nr:hypothetical protein [Deltaproteobacteria bacterium]|tara:strand:+ start:138 stop:491 length:354 start_codon:yes stop_codon:yes gene_type:complete